MNKYSTKLVAISLICISLMPFIIEFLAKQKNSKNKIVFWQYWSGSEAEPLNKLVQKFNNEDHDFTVEMLQISMPRKKILMSIVANVAPDLVHLDGDMVVDFALRNALSDMNPYIQIKGSAKFRAKFIPIYLKMLNIEGKQFALPLMPNSEALHINQNLLDEYNLTTPESLSDIVTIFDELQNQNGEFQKIGFLPSWPPWASRFIVIPFGGNWAEKICLNAADGKCSQFKNIITANSPENIRAWTWIEENFAKKIPSNKLAAFTENFSAYQSPDNPFYSGRIALENNGIWEKHLAQTFAANMKVTVKAFPVDLGLMAKCSEDLQEQEPDLNSKCGATLVSVDALAIPRNAKHPEQAFEFISWLHKQENIEYLALAQHKFTPLKEQSTGFIENHPNPFIETFINLAQSPNAKYFPQLSCVQKYRREIKKAYDRMLRREVNAQTALDELQELMKDCP